MASKTEIRKAFANEAHDIKRIEEECGLSGWQTKDYENAASDSDSILLIGSSRSTITGFAFTRLITNQVSNGEWDGLGVEAELLNIAVLPGYRQKGVGSMLLAGVVETLSDYGPFSLFLEVRESNTSAQEFYLSHDFEEIGIRSGYYEEPSENAVLMKLFRHL